MIFIKTDEKKNYSMPPSYTVYLAGKYRARKEVAKCHTRNEARKIGRELLFKSMVAGSKKYNQFMYGVKKMITSEQYRLSRSGNRIKYCSGNVDTRPIIDSKLKYIAYLTDGSQKTKFVEACKLPWECKKIGRKALCEHMLSGGKEYNRFKYGKDGSLTTTKIYKINKANTGISVRILDPKDIKKPKPRKGLHHLRGSVFGKHVVLAGKKVTQVKWLCENTETGRIELLSLEQLKRRKKAHSGLPK